MNGIVSFEKLLDPNRKAQFEAQTGCVQLHAGMKIAVCEELFDLCGKEPQDNMDIYFTENGKLYCNKPINYLYHLVGNVKEYFDFYYGKGYSIYINSVINGDIKPIQGSVELSCAEV